MLAVNDAPSFTVNGASNFGFTDNTDPFVYQNWATDISAGPDNESTQSLNFVLVYLQGSDAFFDVPPSIDETTGDLSFDINDSADGTVELRIYLTDDGGTDYDGVDTSGDVEITITRTIPDVIFKNSFEVSQNS